MVNFGIIFSFITIVLLIVSLYREYSRTGEFITFWMIFLWMSLWDQFIPGLVFLFSPPQGHPYIPDFTKQDYAFTLLILGICVVLFAIGYFIPSKFVKNSSNHVISHFQNHFKINIPIIYLILFLSISLYLASIIYEIYFVGSFSLFLKLKLVRAYGKRLEYDSYLGAFLTKSGSHINSLSLLLISILFYYRKLYNKQILWGFALPFLGWVLACTNFLRGTQLVYFMCLFILETLRLKEDLIRRNLAESDDVKFVKCTLNPFGLIAIAAVAFFSYGTIRNYLGNIELNKVFQERYEKIIELQTKKMDTYEDDSVKHLIDNSYLGKIDLSKKPEPPTKVDESKSSAILIEIQTYIRGSGLQCFTWILRSFPDKVDFLMGKTFLDMLLLPVPRFIYPSKPKWYGIADITRGMGAPNTTQDAVTMPGELYANFGYFGLILMTVWGLFFGILNKLRLYPRFRFLIAMLIPSLGMTAFWMAFTGTINTLLSVPFWLIAIFLGFKKNVAVTPIENTVKDRI